MLSTTTLAIGLMLLSPVLTAASVVLDDFERQSAQMKSSVLDHVATLNLQPTPAGKSQGTSLVIGWPSQRGGWVEWCYEDRALRPLPQFTDEGCTVGVALWAEAFTGVKYIALRLCDTEGETFEWRVQMPFPERTGWRNVAIPMDLASSSGHWGPWKEGVVIGNGKPDLPFRLQGYAVAFESEYTPAGSLVIDDIVVFESLDH